MSCHGIQKRFACDRCRDQKLRCPRVDNNSQEPCARCQRASALCVTSGARPLGRPRTNPASTAVPGLTTSRGRPPRSQCNSDTSLLPSALEQQRPYGSKSTIVQTPEALEWPPHATIDTTNEYGHPDPMLDTRHAHVSPPQITEATFDGLDHLFGVLVANDDLTASLPASRSAQDGAPSFNLGLDEDRHGSSIHRANRSALANDMVLCGLQHDGAAGDAVPPVDAVQMSAPHTLISLSRLNEDLGQQLAKMDSCPSKPSPLMPHLCFAELSSSADNPVAKAVQTTTSFVAILKSLSPHGEPSDTWSISDSGISVATPGTCPAICPLSMATYLLVISTYLQLVQLFNAMFYRMAEFLGKVTGDTMGECQPRPEFRIAGLPSMPSGLYIKILIEIIEHQFESVESLMGLPAECRISARSTSFAGIFSDRNVSELLHLVMGEVDHETRGRPGAVMTGKSVLLLLRENIKSVQKLLRG
ncbi:uncharacterized protein B0H64DRAFT_356026 [Chaetomium fimeti]|uniref:Zn(2)-C6 fungal-type domain-containing protein n=1 Tax=Chaetomium fimeti TaxID=1854472 RepID=A0AAE0HHB2_9PEZI|nr:hypothetical protein B0H64DRAFT_356026 [Chaetomium fimeti]